MEWTITKMHKHCPARWLGQSDNARRQGTVADACLYCALNLIKVNKLITDLACDKTSAPKLICFLVVAPATDNTVLLHKGHQGN